jgi:hypothetical protein
MTAMPHSEKAFMAAILELARWTGWKAYHVYDARRSEPGFPDAVLVRDTSLIFAELKTATGRVTPAQQAWLDALGHVRQVETYLWRPNNWDSIEQRLQRRRIP